MRRQADGREYQPTNLQQERSLVRPGHVRGADEEADGGEEAAVEREGEVQQGGGKRRRAPNSAPFRSMQEYNVQMSRHLERFQAGMEGLQRRAPTGAHTSFVLFVVQDRPAMGSRRSQRELLHVIGSEHMLFGYALTADDSLCQVSRHHSITI